MQKGREREEESKGSDFYKQTTPPPCPRAGHHMFLGSAKKTKTLKPYYFDFTHGRTETHMRKRGPCARLRSSPKQTEPHAIQGLLRKKSSWGQLEKNNNRKTQLSGKNETQRKSQALMKCFDSMQVLWSCPSICSQSFGVVMFLSTVDKQLI